jgi:hypothetical protein
MTLNNLLISLIAIVFMVACKSQKLKKNEVPVNLPSEEHVAVVVKDSTVLVEDLAPKFIFPTYQVEFDKIKIKSKIDFKSEKLNQSIPANIHIAKDSTVWISISLGLEAARASIKPDSLYFLDRLNRTYYKIGFNEIKEQFDFELTFDMIQALMVGNLPIPIDSTDIFVDNGSYNTILQKRNQIDLVNKFDKELNKLTSINAIDNKSQTNLIIDYKSFTNADGRVVPTVVKVLVKSPNQKSEISLEFEHSKFDFLDRNIRFPVNVPQGYSEGKIPGF